ncbi:UNVERIFIED_CONTAM: hypothetical protein PYX00_005112 [Menopon gallinae]|uniref:Uncharacterized protein n=1 Tax=Menopon gallinae TaxID=328185 RepID=A0AAW2HQ62_9NEOP
MNTGSRLLVLIVTLLLCQCLTEVQCRRTVSTSRRGSSRRNNYDNGSQTSRSGQRGGFFSFFGSKGSTSGSSSRSSSGTSTKQSSKNGNPAWANPNYKPSAPKEPSYGWAQGNRKPDTSQFQKSSQPGSNIGPGGYPVQSGLPQTRVPQQTHGYVPAPQTHGYVPSPQTHGYNPAQKTHGYNPAPQPHGYNPAPQTHGYNPAPQTHGYNQAPQTHGYNPGQPSYGHAPSGYNTGYHPPPPPSYGQPSYPGGNMGGYHPSNNFGHQGFASSHGISPSYYPSQSSYGYPGQGLFGGSHGPKFGGLGLFGGGTGNFGYGSNSWGVPTYGSKSSSGKGKLLTGLALGAAGGYLTSSLVNRISNPWGWGGYGYGSRFGYDRPIVIKEIRETVRPEAPTPEREPEPDPTAHFINCVLIDPTTNITLINPNCSCTVTTVIDPMTNQPISTHNCTTANGQVPATQPAVMPMMPMVPEQQPPNAVNNPNASPAYVGLYQDNMRYGAGPEYGGPPAGQPAETSPAPTVTAKEEDSSTPKTEVSTSEAAPALLNDSPVPASSKVKQFYSQLEQIVNMGKFI